jgi:hypothetical protein
MIQVILFAGAGPGSIPPVMYQIFLLLKIKLFLSDLLSFQEPVTVQRLFQDVILYYLV